MNVLLLTPGLRSDGDPASRYAAGVVPALARAGSLRVIAPRSGPVPPDADRPSEGVPPFDFVPVSGMGMRYAVQAARPVGTALAKDGYRCVLATSWMAGLAVTFAGRRVSGVRRHLVVHAADLTDNPAPFPLAGAVDRIRRTVVRRTDVFFPVSRHAAALLEASGVPGHRMHVVESAIDHHAFAPSDRYAVRRRLSLGSRPIILSVAPLRRASGIDLLVRSMPDILTEHPTAVLVVAGEGPDRNELADLASHLGVADAIRFLAPGDQEDLVDLYSAADVFALTPVDDAHHAGQFGSRFLEAGACGLPVVAPRSGALVDVVQEGVTGLLVAPGRIDSTAAAILFFLNDPGATAEFGAAGRQHVLEWSNWDRTARVVLKHMAGA